MMVMWKMGNFSGAIRVLPSEDVGLLVLKLETTVDKGLLRFGAGNW
jgi:hypothetical protein